MKKKIILSLLLIIPFISILIVIIFRGFLMPSNEEKIKSLKNISYYETKVEYIIRNDRGEETEETTQYYSSEEGVRVEFGDDRVKIYKNDGIYVKDNISNTEYVIDVSMDYLHSIAFMNKILSCPLKSDSLKEGQEEWGDTIYIQVDAELFLQNDHLNTARIFIDKKNKAPIGIVIYDKSGKETVRIIYKDFNKVKEIDSDKFST